MLGSNGDLVGPGARDALVLALGAVLFGCAPLWPYPCGADRSCAGGDGQNAECLGSADGPSYCAIVDGSCPSGRRWDASAAPSLSGLCYEPFTPKLASFAQAVSFPVGETCTAIAVADLDGDGALDLAVTDSLSNALEGAHILLGDGRGGFGAPRPYTTGYNASGVAIGDLDGDQILDLAISNQGINDDGTNVVSVLLGRGDGSFAANVDYLVGLGATQQTSGSNPSAVGIGDLDGDGKVDLAVANNGVATISVLHGRGDGAFDAAIDYQSCWGPVSLAVTRINADAIDELVVACQSESKVQIFYGKPGTPPVGQELTAGNWPMGVTAGDVDADGAPDLIVANQKGDNLSVFLYRNGTYRKAENHPTGRLPTSVTTGDLNGDGHLDLAVANLGSDNLSVLLGRGDGSFETPIHLPTASSPSAIAVADMDLDGRADLVAATYSGSVSVLLNSTE